MNAPIPTPAVWTDDCSGKKDFDGELVSLSTRYWPRGGGFFILDGDGFRASDTGQMPSAKATIYLGSTPSNAHYDNAVALIGAEFEAETQEEVQRAVEAWAQEQFNRICAVLRADFLPEREP